LVWGSWKIVQNLAQERKEAPAAGPSARRGRRPQRLLPLVWL